MSKVKVNERVFIDVFGRALIVRHRRSAVMFMRIANLENVYEQKSFLDPDAPVNKYFEKLELHREYEFNQTGFEELLNYLKEIAVQIWKDFKPKEADSMGADYNEYYDREHDNNGSLYIKCGCIKIYGPHQVVTSDPCIRLYQFNKRKLESFIFDYEKEIEKCAF